MPKLRDRLQSENINIDEFVEEFDHNLKIMDKSGIISREEVSQLRNLRTQMKENEDITAEDVDKTIRKSMRLRQDTSFVDKTVSIIKSEKGMDFNQTDSQAQIDIAKTFEEMAQKGMDPLGLMKGTAEHIKKNLDKKNNGMILNTIPKDSNGDPKIDEVLQYGKDHPGVRKEAIRPLERLLKDAKEKGDESALSKLTYKQLNDGIGLSSVEERSFEGSEQHNEPDSPPAGTALKSWVEGYKKEQLEKANAQSRAS